MCFKRGTSADLLSGWNEDLSGALPAGRLGNAFGRISGKSSFLLYLTGLALTWGDKLGAENVRDEDISFLV